MRTLLTATLVCLLSVFSIIYHRTKTSSVTLKLAGKTTTAPMTTDANPIPFVGLPAVPPSNPSLAKTADMAVPRLIRTIFLAVEQAEGKGARVRRSIGSTRMPNLSPFLLLDHFRSSPGAGFPDHPHRGQETITYLLAGAIDHEDFTGSRGTIWPGDLQFMSAGAGVVHAEMPRHEEGGDPVEGMQLWVDLPQKLKMCDPRYRDLRAAEIPIARVENDSVEVKVISGQSHGIDSVKELAYTPVWLLDIRLRPGARITQNLPIGWNAFAYTLSGSTRFGVGKDGRMVEKFHNVVFEQVGDSVVAEVGKNADEDGRFILVAGLPLDQEVVQYGPFVMNTQEEIHQAMMDFQSHRNGFERANGWQSEIGRHMLAH